MIPRTSINDLPTETVEQISNNLDYQSMERFSQVNKNIYKKLGGLLFNHSAIQGKYIQSRKNDYEIIISGAQDGCLHYLNNQFSKICSYLADCEDEGYNSRRAGEPLLSSKETNRAVWFLNIFSTCSIEFRILALSALLNEKNGEKLKTYVMRSIKSSLIDNGMNKKLLPNVTHFLRNFQDMETINLLEEVLVNHIHNNIKNYVGHVGEKNDIRYLDLKDSVKKLEQGFFSKHINSILLKSGASNIFISGYLYNICLEMMIKKLEKMRKEIGKRYVKNNNSALLDDTTRLSFINWFIETAGKTHANNQEKIDFIKLCFNFLTIESMLSSINRIWEVTVFRFIDDKFKYLASEEFIYDVQASKNNDVINKTKDEMKKMGMDLQANYLSRSKFSFLGSLHPQRHATEVIKDVADKRYVMQL